MALTLIEETWRRMLLSLWCEITPHHPFLSIFICIACVASVITLNPNPKQIPNWKPTNLYNNLLFDMLDLNFSSFFVLIWSCLPLYFKGIAAGFQAHFSSHIRRRQLKELQFFVKWINLPCSSQVFSSNVSNCRRIVPDRKSLDVLKSRYPLFLLIRNHSNSSKFCI